MSVERIEIGDYFSKYNTLPLIDVRSPGEFARGHIVGAQNVALFSDEERAEVGTVYKKQSKEKAIALGFQFVNPKLESFISSAEDIAPNKEVVVHCWRGGMRSQSFAEHLHQNGFDKVYLIEKGYKAFRNYVLAFFEQLFPFQVLGGFTGSGKTEILHELLKQGDQVIDLEGLANHKGSAFGGIGQKEQPTTEFFENHLFSGLKDMDLSKGIWIEDESHNIGRVFLPKAIYDQIRVKKVYFIDIPIDERSKFLVEAYGVLNKDLLKESILKISKRLGPLSTKNAISAIDEGDLFSVAKLTLAYYDKCYLKGLNFRSENNIVKIPMSKVSPEENTVKLLEIVER